LKTSKSTPNQSTPPRRKIITAEGIAPRIGQNMPDMFFFDKLGKGLWDKVRNEQSRRGGLGVKWNSGRASKRFHLRPRPPGGKASRITPNSPNNFPDALPRLVDAGGLEAMGRAEERGRDQAGPEGGAEHGRWHELRNEADAWGAELRAGWRDSCEEAHSFQTDEGGSPRSWAHRP